LGKQIPQKSLILIITENGLDANNENITTIEKYKRLGIIKAKL